LPTSPAVVEVGGLHLSGTPKEIPKVENFFFVII
jgi:hypothetical protein